MFLTQRLKANMEVKRDRGKTLRLKTTRKLRKLGFSSEGVR